MIYVYHAKIDRSHHFGQYSFYKLYYFIRSKKLGCRISTRDVTALQLRPPLGNTIFNILKSPLNIGGSIMNMRHVILIRCYRVKRPVHLEEPGYVVACLRLRGNQGCDFG